MDSELLGEFREDDMFGEMDSVARDSYAMESNGDKALGQLMQVETQVVAGENYKLTYATQGSGTCEINFYVQLTG